MQFYLAFDLRFLCFCFIFLCSASFCFALLFSVESMVSSCVELCCGMWRGVLVFSKSDSRGINVLCGVLCVWCGACGIVYDIVVCWRSSIRQSNCQSANHLIYLAIYLCVSQSVSWSVWWDGMECGVVYLWLVVTIADNLSGASGRGVTGRMYACMWEGSVGGRVRGEGLNLSNLTWPDLIFATVQRSSWQPSVNRWVGGVAWMALRNIKRCDVICCDVPCRVKCSVLYNGV